MLPSRPDGSGLRLDSVCHPGDRLTSRGQFAGLPATIPLSRLVEGRVVLGHGRGWVPSAQGPEQSDPLVPVIVGFCHKDYDGDRVHPITNLGSEAAGLANNSTL